MDIEKLLWSTWLCRTQVSSFSRLLLVTICMVGVTATFRFSWNNKEESTEDTTPAVSGPQTHHLHFLKRTQVCGIPTREQALSC
jgi:hypothetical protein